MARSVDPLLYRVMNDLEVPIDRRVSSARLSPSGAMAVALYAPSDAAPLQGVALIDMGSVDVGTTWDVPGTESLVGTIDFDGRWVLAPLESGRLFVVDTVSDSSQVVEVYAEVWFD